MAYTDSYDDTDELPGGFVPYEPPEEEDTSIPETARHTAGGLPPGFTAGPPDGFVPYQPPEAGSRDAKQLPSGFTAGLPKGFVPYQPSGQATEPEAEGQFVSGVKAFAKGVIPTTAGVLGAVASAPLGAPAGPVGMIGTALAGGFATSAAAQKAQDWVLEQFRGGPDIQAAVNAKEHPWTTAIAGAAPALLTLNPSVAGRQLIPGIAPRLSGLAERGVSAAVSGAVEGAQQLVTGEYHPEALATSIGIGALAPRTRSWVDPVEQAGARVAAKIHGTPGSKGAAGTAEEQPKPVEEPVGDSHNKPTRSERDYPAEPTAGQAEEAPSGTNVGRIDPTLASVFEAEAQRQPGETAAGAPAERPPVEAVTEPPAEPAPRPTAEPAPEPAVSPTQFDRQAFIEATVKGPEATAEYARTAGMPDEQVRAEIYNAGDSNRTSEARYQRFLAAKEASPTPTPREAIEQRVPGQPVDEVAEPPAKFANVGEELKARNAAKQAMRRQDMVRGRPIKTAPLPIGTEQAILEEGAARTVAGGAGGGAGGPPTVGQAAAAAGGTPPPGPTSMAYAPPQKRSNLGTLWRSMKLLVGSDTGPHGREAERIIRGSYGDAQRLFEQTVNVVAPHQATVRSMSAADRAAMNDRIEGGSRFPDWNPTPEQGRLIGDVKQAMDLWKDRLQRLGRTAEMNFIENYLPHMYKNEDEARQFFSEFAGKRGGAGSTKKRTLPTYEDAKEAGLVPFSDDPIELATRYGLSMKNFIASNDVLERGVQTGVVGKFKPGKTVGATGSPEPQQVGGPPPGWKKLNAPSGDQYRDYYAPEDFADKYNSFYSRGMRGVHAPIYDALRNSNAAWTQLELGLNAYHFFTMANEAIISDVAKGLSQVMSGKFREGAVSMAKAPLAPRTRYIEGKRFQQEYLDPNSTNPIASILAEANARPIGRGHALDILGSTGDEKVTRGAFIKNFSPNKIEPQLKQAWDEIKQDWGLADTVGKQVLYPFKQASRALQTVGAPLFDKYIPALKAGAVHSQMEAWLGANPHIDITTPDGRRAAVDAARKIADSTDNRFGEMVHDNLFMNQTLRQSAMLAMRSFSWTMGAMREIAGGTYAAGKAGALSLKNRENRFSMAHPEYDPRISYALAFPFVVGTTSAIYQYLRAGEAPQDWRDLYAPRTGGTIPGLGGKGQVKEHALMPGFHKDVYGWLMHPQREAYAKLAGGWTTGIEQLTNEDWRGDPIYKRGANPLEQLQQRAAHLLSRFGPIGVRSIIKGQPETSGITPVETALGFRAPGVDIQDPVRLENWLKKKTEKEWKDKQRHEKTEERKYARTRVYEMPEREAVPQ